VQKMHYFFINKFSACWVPDNAENNILAGELSHPKILPVPPLQYLGPLARFKKTGLEKKYTLLVLLSGPEPQRTVFENLLVEELENINEPVLFVRGLPGNDTVLMLQNKNTEVYNHLPAADLSIAIQQSEMVICRSGYTSVWNWWPCSKKQFWCLRPGKQNRNTWEIILCNKNYSPAYRKKTFLFLPHCSWRPDFRLVLWLLIPYGTKKISGILLVAWSKPLNCINIYTPGLFSLCR
jgi:hypothetical protein